MQATFHFELQISKLGPQSVWSGNKNESPVLGHVRQGALFQGMTNQLPKASSNAIALGGPLVNFFAHNKADACGMNNALSRMWY